MSTNAIININASTLYLAHSFVTKEADKFGNSTDYVWIERKKCCWTLTACNGYAMGSFMIDSNQHMNIENDMECPEPFGIRLTKDQLKLIKPTKKGIESEIVKITLSSEDKKTITVCTHSGNTFTAERSSYPLLNYKQMLQRAVHSYDENKANEGNRVCCIPIKAINLFDFSGFFEGGNLPVFKKADQMTIITYEDLKAPFDFVGLVMQIKFRDKLTAIDIATRAEVVPSWAL